MWYTYFNKESWKLRIWKGYNLKFNHNAYDLAHVHYTSKFTNLIMRLIKTTTPLRCASVFLILGFADIKSWYSSLTEIKQEVVEESDDYSKVLYLNRYGLPTRPTRSIEEFIYFITNQEALDKGIQMTSIDEISDIQSDITNGLDGIMNEEDKNIYNYYEKYLMNQSH